MTQYAKHVSVLETPQTSPIPGKPMVVNSAGGYVFQVDDWVRLDRWILQGCDGGTYYASERKLTIENAACVERCLKADAARTVNRIAEISDAGRAPKNDPAIFALAICISKGDAAARTLAIEKIPMVIRIGTHLFSFAETCKQLGGWTSSLRKAIANWYRNLTPDQMAYQVTKYAQRNGWSHADLLRYTSRNGRTKFSKEQAAVIRFAVRGNTASINQPKSITRGVGDKAKTTEYPALNVEIPRLLEGVEKVKGCTDVGEACRLISDYGLVREHLPTELLTHAKVWEALLEKMPLTATIRNLATMTRVGLIAPLCNAISTITSRLSDAEYLKKSRIHPIAVLAAMKTYSAGHGERGQNTWQPNQQIVDALDGAFYTSFGNVEKTGKRWLLALDVSGSMGGSMIAGIPGLDARTGSAAMALVTAAVEPAHHFVGFTSGAQDEWSAGTTGSILRGGMFATMGAGISPLSISPRQRLNDVCSYVKGLPMGGTDCALPMLYAAAKKIPVDVFTIFTDSETYANPKIHPCQALRQYRKEMGINAKLIVCGMTSSQFSIADPADAGSLDCVGFDVSTPNVMADFAVH